MRKVLPHFRRTAIGSSLLIAMLAFPAIAADKIVGRSGNVSVTQDELETFLRSLDAPTRQRLAADRTMLEQLIQSRLAQKAVLAEAESRDASSATVTSGRKKSIKASSAFDAVRWLVKLAPLKAAHSLRQLIQPCTTPGLRPLRTQYHLSVTLV